MSAEDRQVADVAVLVTTIRVLSSELDDLVSAVLNASGTGIDKAAITSARRLLPWWCPNAFNKEPPSLFGTDANGVVHATRGAEPMNIEMKTGWVARDLIYSMGGERWLFHETEPYGEEEFVAAEGKHRPAKVRQIVYFFVDEAAEP